LLAGVTTAGVLMAIFQSNAGGAWDNAKKMIEAEGRKGSDAHKAAVVGDTVGDPFKDTSGPSLNILLKLMSVVALVIAPSIAISADAVMAYNDNQPAMEMVQQEMKKEVTVEMKDMGEGLFQAVVTTVTDENGEVSEDQQIFEGTKEEVKAKIAAFNETDESVKVKIEKVVEEVEIEEEQ
ncbi:MAG: sodium/proton-translocating pyrophosphatase, partial [Eudoraea sp.]|nr:sodium/proton-translocating pyrophosphatase [Eudoraea sp.]